MEQGKEAREYCFGKVFYTERYLTSFLISDTYLPADRASGRMVLPCGVSFPVDLPYLSVLPRDLP